MLNHQTQRYKEEFPDLNEREVLPKLIRELREVRDQANVLKKRGDQLRDHVEELLEEAGGEYVDEVSGLRAWLEKVPRWDFDPTKLHKLVEDGLITEKEFADCLETTVNKKVVNDWIGQGLLTDRQLNRANAKVGTKIVTTVQVKPLVKA